jgi:Cu/Ag efflux pump CusA
MPSFAILAVETGVVMVVYLHEAVDKRMDSGLALADIDIQETAIEGAVQRLRQSCFWEQSCGIPNPQYQPAS